ncbi:ATP-grasp domain-containing protein [Candidatus Pacearchaeota archaeon]|nr:ATP-grasp domain-containing protein [Candidatus Pacearchaeota archaeon]
MAKIGIIGSGGREHALGWKFSQHGHFVYYFPGNGGTEMEFRGKNIKIDGTKEENFPIVYDFVEREKLDMLVVGPEGPLVKKIIDYFNYWGYKRIVGPTGIAAELESDKFFSYDLMKELEIGQADSVKCYSLEEARKAINERATDNGIVIKARGLTGGKGVTVCNSKKQALDIISEHIDKYGFHNLIAERLFGEEYSIFGISDGSIVLPLELSVQDFKRLQEDDKGPNTGGMGSYCPTPFASAQIIRDLTQKVMNPRSC